MHDVRNLLSTILGNLDYAKSILESDIPTEDELKDLREAIAHARLASANLLSTIERAG